jgi:arylsulfatase A-like enzyme
VKERPNILLILTDQQRWDTIGGRSGCRTPNTDGLARQGVTFDRSYTPVSLCCPARAMLVSGAYSWHNGVFVQVHVPQRMQFGMKEGTVTYAQRLADEGYRTAYLGKWHADWKKGPLDYGYQRVSALRADPDSLIRSNQPPEDQLASLSKFENSVSATRTVKWVGGADWPVWAEVDGPVEGRRVHFVADRAQVVLEELCSGNDPWLMEVHFVEPHDPYAPHVEFARRYDADDIPLPDNWNEEYVNKPGMSRKEAANYADVTEEDVRQAIAHYWAYTEELDHYVGKILEALERCGQAEETLVLFTSDHGDLLGNHGMFIKSWMPYEEAHRIPMVARWPGVIPAATQARQLVHLHDWAHTFCDVAGAEPLPFDDGISLAPLLRDPRGEPSRDAIMSIYYGCEFLHVQRMMISQRYKYVFNGFDIDELYDLETDPSEMLNRIDDPGYSDVVEDMRRKLYGAMDRFDDPFKSKGLYGGGRYLPSPDG